MNYQEPEIEYVEGYEELEEEEDMEDFSGFPSKMSNFNDDEHGKTHYTKFASLVSFLVR